MKIYLSNTFIQSANKLEINERRAIEATIKKMMHPNVINALNEEKIHNGFSSARVNLDIRIIYQEEHDIRALVYVDHHDQAYDWASTHTLAISQCQAYYIANTSFSLEDIEVSKANKSIFADLSISEDMIKLIVGDGLYAKKIYSLSTYDEVFAFLVRHHFVDEVKEAIMGLLNGENPIEIVKCFSTTISQSRHKSFRHQQAQRRFYLLEDETLLAALFGDDFEEWQIFLHPSQRYLVTKNFSGPALIEGGPGTGKTVVGMHRAVYLAKHVYNQPHHRILLCTYSKKLSQFIKDKLAKLATINKIDPERIEVDYIGGVILKTCDENNISYEGFNDQTHTNEIEYRAKNPPFPLEFRYPLYVKEYEEIVQANHITTLDAYLSADRRGMRIPLNQEQRKKVWQWMEFFIEKKTSKQILNNEDVAKLLEDAIDQGVVQPKYDAIIIDESQDLSPVKIRVLHKLLKTKTNNLFLLSDQDQRIFRMQSFKKNTDIAIVGRTHHLYLNYRTSKAIHDFASQALSDLNVKNLKKRYECLYVGLEPHQYRFKSEEEQQEKAIEIIRRLIQVDFYKPYQIGIVSTVSSKLKKMQQTLKEYNIPFTFLEQKVYPKESCGVCVSTVQGIKGLEFRALIYLDYDYNIYRALPVEGLRERLQYTGCTRAREQLFIINLIGDSENFSLIRSTKENA